MINTAILEIIDIRPDGNNQQALNKTTVAGVYNQSYSNNTEPLKYAIINNTADNYQIKIDYTPTVDWDKNDNPYAKFILSFYPNYRVFGDGAEYKFQEFEDYDEYNMQAGNWKLPSDWHMLIVEGALAKLFPEYLENWYSRCERQNTSRSIESGMKLGTMLGVSTYPKGRGRNPYNGTG